MPYTIDNSKVHTREPFFLDLWENLSWILHLQKSQSISICIFYSYRKKSFFNVGYQCYFLGSKLKQYWKQICVFGWYIFQALVQRFFVQFWGCIIYNVQLGCNSILTNN